MKKEMFAMTDIWALFALPVLSFVSSIILLILREWFPALFCFLLGLLFTIPLVIWRKLFFAKIRLTDEGVCRFFGDELINIMHILLNLINIQYEYFEFNLDFNKCRVYLKDIIYFTTLKGSKKIYLKTINKEYLFYGKIKEIYSSLERYRFMLPHNSYVINYDYIKNIKFDKIILINEEEVPVSKYKVKNIKELQVKFMEDMCAKNASNRIFNL